MIILAIRTDQPEAELTIFDDQTLRAHRAWQAHRQLAATIHQQLQALLHDADIDQLAIRGIVCFKGPGSFTGLRIGMSVGNAMAYVQNIAIVSQSGETWQRDGITRLLNGENERIAVPLYSSAPHTTTPKK